MEIVSSKTSIPCNLKSIYFSCIYCGGEIGSAPSKLVIYGQH